MKPKFRNLLWVGLLIVTLTLLFFNLDYITTKIIFQPSFYYKETIKTQAYYYKKTEHFIPVEQDSLHIEKYSVQNPKGVIVYFHGNRSSLVRWGPIAAELNKFDYNVVCWDYRGYGKSSGRPSIQNILSDGQVVLDYVEKTATTSNIVLYGRSLGSGVACYLAEYPNVRKIILETPYYGLQDVIKYHVPILSAWVTLNIPSFEYVKNVTKPILVLHGDHDKVIPLESAKKLYSAMQNPNKKMIEFRNGTHNNLYQFRLYWQSIENFLND